MKLYYYVIPAEGQKGRFVVVKQTVDHLLVFTDYYCPMSRRFRMTFDPIVDSMDIFSAVQVMEDLMKERDK